MVIAGFLGVLEGLKKKKQKSYFWWLTPGSISPKFRFAAEGNRTANCPETKVINGVKTFYNSAVDIWKQMDNICLPAHKAGRSLKTEYWKKDL